MECLRTLVQLEGPDNYNPKLVILIHGLAGHNWTFRDMKPAIADAGLQVNHWNYASTRGSLTDHVAAFHKMMNAMEGINEVQFVAHSLGGLLLRKALADEGQPWRRRIKVKQLIMIATPNQGAVLAARFKDSEWFQYLFKGAGQDLTPGYTKTIPLPTMPYHLIAGQLEGEGNKKIPGPDDGVVAVSSVAIKSGDKPIIVKANHMSIMVDEGVVDYVIKILTMK